MLNDPERELRTMLERLAGDDEEWLLVAAEVLGKATKMTKDLIREADDDKARRRVQKLIELAGRSAHENPPAASLSAVLSAVLEQALGPVQQLLHIVLLGGLKPTAPSSTCAEKEYRLEAARFYYGAETVPEKLMCMVTGEVLDASSIRAGHIYRQEWNRSLLEYTASMTINDARNLLFMRKQVEQKFDAFQITIIPQQEEDVYQVAVLDPELLTPKQMYIGLGSGADTKKWADLQEQSLHLHELLPDRRPAARLLAMHATLAVDWAEKHNWVGKGQWKVPEAGWRSPGFDPTQMRKFLDTLDTLEKVKKFTTGAQP